MLEQKQNSRQYEKSSIFRVVVNLWKYDFHNDLFYFKLH